MVVHYYIGRYPFLFEVFVFEFRIEHLPFLRSLYRVVLEAADQELVVPACLIEHFWLVERGRPRVDFILGKRHLLAYVATVNYLDLVRMFFGRVQWRNR